MPTSGEKKRLFLAVNLSVAATRKIAEAVGRMRPVADKKGMRVGWVPAANLHVTLKFLGWTRAEVASAIQDRVLEVVKGVRVFDVGARGVGAYPTVSAARVIWAGVLDGAGVLAGIAGKLDAAMAGLGFPREDRAYSPHVTLGRVKEGKGAEEVLAPFRGMDFGNSLIREVVLYESLMRSSGSEYVAQARIPLEGALERPERQTRSVEPSAERESPESEDPDGGQP